MQEQEPHTVQENTRRPRYSYLIIMKPIILLLVRISIVLVAYNLMLANNTYGTITATLGTGHGYTD